MSLFASSSTSSGERPSGGSGFSFGSSSTSSGERPSGASSSGFSFGSSSTSSSQRPSGGSGFSFGSSIKFSGERTSDGSSLGGSSDEKAPAKVDSVSKVLLARRKRVGTGHKRQIQKRKTHDEGPRLTRKVEPMFCDFRDAVTEPLSKVIASKASAATIQLTISKLFEEYVRVSGMKPGAVESS